MSKMSVTMMRLCFAAVLLLSVGAKAEIDKRSIAATGDGPGNAGDPSQYQVYDRVQFALDLIRRDELLDKEIIKVLEKAAAELVVTPDSSQKEMGIVRLDKERTDNVEPKGVKKYTVYVNPKKFQENFKLRYTTLDLTRWAVHEALQTQINPKTKRPYDIDEEYTKGLRFIERSFEKWLQKNKPAAPVHPTKLSLLKGEFHSDGPAVKNLTISYEPIFKELKLKGHQNRSKSIYFRRNKGPEFIRLVREFRSELGAYVNDDGSDTYYGYNTGCSFIYKVQLIPTEDGFYFRDYLPRDIKSGSCRATGYEWQKPTRFVLKPANYHVAYSQAVSRAQKAQTKLDFQLFEAAAINDAKLVEELLAKGANPNAKDWRGRSPIYVAAWVGADEALTALKNVSKIDFKVPHWTLKGYKQEFFSLLADATKGKKLRNKVIKAAIGMKLTDLGYLTLMTVVGSIEDAKKMLDYVDTNDARTQYLNRLFELKPKNIDEYKNEILGLAKQGVSESAGGRLLSAWAEKKDYDYVDDLLDAGIDVNAVWDEKTLPFVVAEQGNFSKFMEYIERFKLSLNHDLKQNTYFSLALAHGDEKAVDWFVQKLDLNKGYGLQKLAPIRTVAGAFKSLYPYSFRYHKKLNAEGRRKFELYEKTLFAMMDRMENPNLYGEDNYTALDSMADALYYANGRRTNAYYHGAYEFHEVRRVYKKMARKGAIHKGRKPPSNFLLTAGGG